MKTFDRKIADNSHSSLTKFFNSTLTIPQIVTKNVTCNFCVKLSFFDQILGGHLTTSFNDRMLHVTFDVTFHPGCGVTIFDFIFQTFKNERNEND